jgi:hypothetical protein
MNLREESGIRGLGTGAGLSFTETAGRNPEFRYKSKTEETLLNCDVLSSRGKRTLIAGFRASHLVPRIRFSATNLERFRHVASTGTDAGFAVLSLPVEIWRASRNKTANPYVIEIAI